MLVEDPLPPGVWPPEAVVDRWRDALVGAADRIRGERGVEEPQGLSMVGGWLRVTFGDVQLFATGMCAHTQVEGLHEELDEWVAFRRPAGPGRVLERDRALVAGWRAELPGQRAFWDRVARRLADDVAATTDLAFSWVVEVQDAAPVPEVLPERAHSGAARPVWMREFPQVVWRDAATEVWLPDEDDEGPALWHLADELQGRVSELAGFAWPRCPRHPHPLATGQALDGRALWQCAADPAVVFEVGALPG